jgi:hypothetical protein
LIRWNRARSPVVVEHEGFEVPALQPHKAAASYKYLAGEAAVATGAASMTANAPLPSWEMSRPQDCSRINVDQPHELSYWTRKWDVTPAQLRDAVERVGPYAAAVAGELHKDWISEFDGETVKSQGDGI